MRTFIAIELSEEIKQNIGALIERLKTTEAGVKWVEPKNLHITLKFLGEVPEREVKNLIDLTTEALKGGSSFKSRFEGGGTFPEGKNPRVVWIGTTEGAEEQRELSLSLEKVLSKAGYREEKREFKAHITIGRVKEKKNLDALLKELNKAKDQKFGEEIVDHVNIMKSTLNPKGPIYEVVKRIPLK